MQRHEDMSKRHSVPYEFDKAPDKRSAGTLNEIEYVEECYNA